MEIFFSLFKKKKQHLPGRCQNIDQLAPNVISPFWKIFRGTALKSQKKKNLFLLLLYFLVVYLTDLSIACQGEECERFFTPHHCQVVRRPPGGVCLHSSCPATFLFFSQTEKDRHGRLDMANTHTQNTDNPKKVSNLLRLYYPWAAVWLNWIPASNPSIHPHTSGTGRDGTDGCHF